MSISAGFPEAVAQTLADGRELAESRMDSLCKIYYGVGRGAYNPATQKQEPVFADRATGVKCRVAAQRQVNSNTTQPADALGAKVTREISIPVDSTDVRVGDFVELTTIGAMTDEALLGVRFRVVDAGSYSQGTARRLKVEVDL